MIVKCINVNIKKLDKKFQEFAFTQDDDGIVELVEGKQYLVFGIRTNKIGKFYLVITEDSELPWWMPDGLFEATDSKIPKYWISKTDVIYGKDTTISDPIYFDASEDIEDGTDEGFEVFQKMKINIGVEF